MILKIDTDFLLHNKLSIGEYLILAVLYENKSEFESVIKLIEDDELDKNLDSLEHRKFIHLVDEDNGSHYDVTDEYKNLIETNLDKSFITLWNTYPSEVHNGKGGFRILRAKTIESKDFEKCRKKYEYITKGKPWLYSVIQIALEKQLQLERIANGLMYMREFEVWLNNNVWERYIGKLAEHTSSERVKSI